MVIAYLGCRIPRGLYAVDWITYLNYLNCMDGVIGYDCNECYWIVPGTVSLED